MKVCFVQSGGFAGTIRGCEVNTAELETPDAEQLKRLVVESGLVKSHRSVSEQARDARQYEITIEDERSDICVSFDDQNVPDAAKTLLGFLQKRSKPRGL
ncbi:protealysin inhibitor emfourin [Pseudomonas huanghezhanensis]|uniref:protealysin inhibitor emfourin n=1 Tax=Pseudomonas huanghezhanensis TaxID=3002903 RepID=UPI002285DBD5|nr:protealysin inhibitor emfourin [Pseudomonas sp. BSw22131]